MKVQELEGKVAIVTGGASGIGRRSVELFAAEGAKVVIADRNAQAGEEMAAGLGGAAHFVQTDVAEAAQIERLIGAAVEKFGRLDIMFNNAGIMTPASPRFLDENFATFRQEIDVNLLGVIMGTQAAARQMAGNGGGSIINTSSIAGIQPGFAFLSYRVAKAGVAMFSQSVAIDLAEYGIRVNCLAPGHIETPMTSFADPSLTPEQARKVDEAVGPVWRFNRPLKRQGKPEDVAQAALYLASDRSAQITGIVLPVDGGITAGDPINHLAAFAQARAAALG